MRDWILTPEKYLKESEVRKLRHLLEEKSIVALAKKQKKAIRDWMIIDLALSSGLRVSEICNLRHKDLFIKKGESSLFVRYAKGDKHRIVAIGDKLRRHLKQFITWKRQVGEPAKPNSFFFSSERSDQITRSAVYDVFKDWARAAGLDRRYTIHSARHTYGTMLYKATKDLRLVQKQLGHSSSRLTEIYADIMPEDAQEGVNKLFAEAG